MEAGSLVGASKCKDLRQRQGGQHRARSSGLINPLVGMISFLAEELPLPALPIMFHCAFGTRIFY